MFQQTAALKGLNFFFFGSLVSTIFTHTVGFFLYDDLWHYYYFFHVWGLFPMFEFNECQKRKRWKPFNVFRLFWTCLALGSLLFFSCSAAASCCFLFLYSTNFAFNFFSIRFSLSNSWFVCVCLWKERERERVSFIQQFNKS